MMWASKILLSIALGIICYTGTLFGVDLYRYYSLSCKAPVKVVQWEVKELERDIFAVEATFISRGKERHYQFIKPLFKNKFIAEKHANLWAKESWEVFSSPNKEHFVLQKFFPFMKGIHFILSLGVVLWFVYLFDVNKFYRQGT